MRHPPAEDCWLPPKWSQIGKNCLAARQTGRERNLDWHACLASSGNEFFCCGTGCRQQGSDVPVWSVEIGESVMNNVWTTAGEGFSQRFVTEIREWIQQQAPRPRCTKRHPTNR